MDPALHERLMTALRRVADPELAESIVELGLVERIAVEDAQLLVVIVPTSATCPMADVLLDEVAATLAPLCPPALTLTVRMDWDAVWSPERMSPALRQRFGW